VTNIVLEGAMKEDFIRIFSEVTTEMFAETSTSVFEIMLKESCVKETHSEITFEFKFTYFSLQLDLQMLVDQFNNYFTEVSIQSETSLNGALNLEIEISFDLIIPSFCIQLLPPTDPLENCTDVADIVLIYDGSGSMAKDKKWDKQKQWMKKLSSKFNPSPLGNRFAALQYNDRPHLAYTFSEADTPEKLQTQAENIEFTGKSVCAWCSQIGRAYEMAVDQFEVHARPEAKKAVLVLADGYNNGDKHKNPDEENSHAKLASSLNYFEENQIELFFVKIGEGKMRQSDPKKRPKTYYEVTEFINNPDNWFETGPKEWDALDDISELLTRQMCSSHHETTDAVDIVENENLVVEFEDAETDVDASDESDDTEASQSENFEGSDDVDENSDEASQNDNSNEDSASESQESD